jgi:hypothetical protein
MKKHGVIGNSKDAQRRHKLAALKARLPAPVPATDLTDPLQCPLCEFKAQWLGGLSHHKARIHGIKTTKRTRKNGAALATIETAPSEIEAPRAAAPADRTNGHYKAEDDRDHRLEAAATFAAGRVQELLTNVAGQFDLPARTFTALVLKTLHATALR